MAYKDIEKKTAYQNEYIKKSYDRINLTVPKGKKEIIRTSALEKGESVNTFINRLIDTELEQGERGSYGFSSTEQDTDVLSHLFSHTEVEKITALLQDGQTVEDYVKSAVLDKLNADTEKAEEQDIAMGIKKKKR